MSFILLHPLSFFFQNKQQLVASQRVKLGCIQFDQIKIAKCLKKLPINGLTRKMNAFDTFTKIA